MICTGDVAAARKYAVPLIAGRPGVGDVEGDTDGKAVAAPAAWPPDDEQAAAPIAAKAIIVGANSIRGTRINSPR
jgi:hypothetical protein